MSPDPSNLTRGGSQSKRLASRGLGVAGKASGFTLVEIMIVLGIMALMLSWAAPSVVRGLKKEGMRKAVSDVVEACSHARARAILQGEPTELVIRAEDGNLLVRPLPREESSHSAAALEGEPSGGPGLTPVEVKPFTAHLEDDIAVELIDVNFRDQMQADEAHVRFFPNGTCDEFTIVLRSADGQIRKITLDIVTSMADVATIR